MSSDKTAGAVALRSTSALTAAYGDGAVGWATEEIDVSAYDYVTISLGYAHVTAALLSLKPLGGEPGMPLADYAQLLDADGAGVLSVTELTLATSGSLTFQLPPMDVRAMSTLALLAKTDTGDGTLDVVYLGHRLHMGGLPTTPDAPPVIV